MKVTMIKFTSQQNKKDELLKGFVFFIKIMLI